ncbi:ABC transporter substrate-binding protein [Paeniglutamicibacter sp. NPDC091659]|uniref:ABC transporter substrate-binding protein n=1 Tax=Paeniglutamicibacter sp. NPDC091659 TaxID=3364389 RepID=UPI0037F2A8A3
MALTPRWPLRILVEGTAEVAPVAGSSLASELFSTTRIIDYARAMRRSHLDSVVFFLELPSTRRLIHVRLTHTHHGSAAKVIVEAELVPLPYKLTFRELEVLTLLAAGLSNPQIAGHLSTSPRTVSTQVERVLAKMGAASRTAASVQAALQGCLKMPLPAPADQCHALSIAALERSPEAPSERDVPAQVSGAAPIRLVLAYPKSGPASDDGQQSLRGALLAVEQANAAGGIGGRPIQPIEVDADIYSGTGIIQTFDVIRDLDPDAVMLSYVFDEETALGQAAAFSCPVLHTMTSQRQVISSSANPERFANVFQAVPTETSYGAGLLRFLQLLDVRVAASRAPGEQPTAAERRIAFIQTDADAGRIDDEATLASLGDQDWQITLSAVMPHAAEQRTALAARIVSDNPAVVVISEFLPKAMALMHLVLLEAGSRAVVYCIYAPSIPVFQKLVGPHAEGLVWSTVSGTYADELAGDFVQAFKQRFAVSPGHSQAGLGYDLVHLLANAWRQSAESRDFAATLAALRSTRHRGVNGSYMFSRGHQTSLSYPDQTADPSLGQAQLIYQIQGGMHRCLDPQPYANARFIRPSWVNRYVN